MTHDNIQCTAFLVYLFDEFYLPPTHRAFRTHTVTAGYLFVLVDKFMSNAESDAYIIIMFQHLQLAAFRTRMKIYDAILITEVHRNYVGITFQISNAYKTGIAMENNGFDSLFIFNNDSFHNGCLAYHRGHGVHEVFLLPDFLAYSVVNLLFY